MPCYVYACETHGETEIVVDYDDRPTTSPCPGCKQPADFVEFPRGGVILTDRLPGDWHTDDKRCATNGDLGWLRYYKRNGIHPREEMGMAKKLLAANNSKRG